ncbi:hypothetical protein [Ruminococcus sp.]|uniref:hypothetical protein n=1 Tax=Ruminococcus sp. TaxID=41978 RepID=UPI0025FE16BB|nr:hypothetical protein [Ruminococcus sp.]
MTNVNRKIQDMISDSENSRKDILNYVKNNCRDEALTPQTLGMLFEVYAEMEPQENDASSWFSKEISIDELKNIHPAFQSTNGCQWARSDTSYLGKKYVIIRKHKRGKVASIKLDGANNKSIKRYRCIKKEIIDSISKKRCAILDVGTQIEVDHKDGHYDVLSNQDKSTQKESDFQPLSKAANDAKRGHCNKCIKTGKRYNATALGYSQGFILGNEDTKTCQGCYWYDPQYFNKVISKDYKKNK